MWAVYICALAAIVIITGNLAVMVIFTRTPSLRMRKYYLLISLSVADFFVGLISVPYYLALLVHSPLSEASYLVYTVQDILFGTASVFGLTAVAIERAYAVYFPFKHRTLWKGAYMIGIAVVWLVAILFAFITTSEYAISIIYPTSASILISLLGIIISYVLIWIKMHCMTNMVSHAIQKRDKKMTVTLLIVTIVSLLAWIPFQVVTVYAITCGSLCLHDKEKEIMITKVLQYSNSLVNPIIYGLRVPQFKRALLKRLLCNRDLSVEVGHELAARNRDPPSVVPINTNDNMTRID
ncbi:trace amine-associated receptor 4-like [Actinia tenebrosa]|uniref:Trace amine-associated receptor 4-like n=1 Tax=Actinia tenebrosa TaxID=6105 RepID=A0A6P8J2E3_ACTTE|nr:trace amine-associated receptor 4-like [Actinia tenebrosa]